MLYVKEKQKLSAMVMRLCRTCKRELQDQSAVLVCVAGMPMQKEKEQAYNPPLEDVKKNVLGSTEYEPTRVYRNICLASN